MSAERVTELLQAADRLPDPDLTVMLQVVDDDRRAIEFRSSSDAGERLLGQKNT